MKCDVEKDYLDLVPGNTSAVILEFIPLITSTIRKEEEFACDVPLSVNCVEKP